MSNWFTTAPLQVPDQAQKRETVLYGPRGEPLVVREPRPVGFRPPPLNPTLIGHIQRGPKP